MTHEDPRRSGHQDRSFEDSIVSVIRAIPEGDVMTYGEVAAAAGFPGRARGVGRILAISPEEMPWWRVVGADHRLISPSAGEQARLLGSEGWTIERWRLLRSEPGERGESGGHASSPLQ